MKFKERLREKLRNWLFTEELSKLESAEEKYKEAEDLCKRATGYFKAAKEEYAWGIQLTDECQKMMNSMVDVGIDVGFHSDDHSWAVVCIKGHPEYVKFAPLLHNDARDILDFLKRFEYSNRVVDSPFNAQ